MSLIIADIAGEYDALMRLVNRFPDEDYILVGDLNDRGFKSAEVVQWAMSHPRVTALMGNHEHMMLDYYLGLGMYQDGLWFYNGGAPTHKSFDHKPDQTVLDWLKTRPLFKMLDNCLVTHAPVHPTRDISAFEGIDSCAKGFDLSLIWNREEPSRKPYFQVFGHNSHWGLSEISDSEGVYAMCIDQSREKKLTGLLWPQMEIHTEPYEALKKQEQTKEQV